MAPAGLLSRKITAGSGVVVTMKPSGVRRITTRSLRWTVSLVRSGRAGASFAESRSVSLAETGSVRVVV